MKAAAAAPDAMRADEALNAQAGFTQDDGVVEVELQSETIPLETEQTMTYARILQKRLSSILICVQIQPEPYDWYLPYQMH